MRMFAYNSTRCRRHLSGVGKCEQAVIATSHKNYWSALMKILPEMYVSLDKEVTVKFRKSVVTRFWIRI